MKNFGKPRIKINHKDLTRADDSMYRSICPVCEDGMLLVTRNPKTFRIEKNDNCISCGQQFEYLDFKEIV